jgi:hypothetical protein
MVIWIITPTKRGKTILWSFLFYDSSKSKEYLLYEEGKYDEPNKECARQNSDTDKVFLDIGIIRGELGARRRNAAHGRRLVCSFVFLSHFISPSFVIAQRRQCAVYQQDMDSTR